VEADTTLNWAIDGARSDADADDFASATSGTVTILEGDTEATFTIDIAEEDGAEFAENFTVALSSGGNEVASAVVTIRDTSTDDSVAPTVDADQAYAYDENQEADAVIATVTAEDNEGGTGVESYAIASGNDDGYFAINADGEITLTEDGLASAANDFETGDNEYTLGVTATDGNGNTSDEVEVELDVSDVDDVAPNLSTAIVDGASATLTFDEDLDDSVAAPAAGDFTVELQGASGTISVSSVTVSDNTVELGLGRAPAAGETFQVDYTPGTNPLQDAAGNEVAAFTDETLNEDTTAPTVTADQEFSYQEGAYDDTNDVVGAVDASDDYGITSFSIETGNDDGYFAIDGNGNITLTTAGLDAAVASNDFETTPNSFNLGIMATDGAGNESAVETVNVSVTNDPADDPGDPESFTLTAGADQIPGDLVGSEGTTSNAGDIDVSGVWETNAAGDDVGTFNNSDNLNAGDGTSNTLNVRVTDLSQTTAAAVNRVPILKSFQIINVINHHDASTTESAALNHAQITGVNQIWSEESVNGSVTEHINIKDNSATIGFRESEGAVRAQFNTNPTTLNLALADGVSSYTPWICRASGKPRRVRACLPWKFLTGS
jgi:hypothetical protein